jgi:hypothetical protein
MQASPTSSFRTDRGTVKPRVIDRLAARLIAPAQGELFSVVRIFCTFFPIFCTCQKIRNRRFSAALRHPPAPNFLIPEK